MGEAAVATPVFIEGDYAGWCPGALVGRSWLAEKPTGTIQCGVEVVIERYRGERDAHRGKILLNLLWIGIDPEYRRQGYARMLVENAVSWARLHQTHKVEGVRCSVVFKGCADLVLKVLGPDIVEERVGPTFDELPEVSPFDGDPRCGAKSLSMLWLW